MRSVRRVALVTGGAKRVGRAIVLRLLEAGFDVAFTFHSSRAEAANLVQEQLQSVQRGRTLLPIRADLTKPISARRAIVSSFKRSFTRLDLLVNNASIYSPGDEKLR